MSDLDLSAARAGALASLQSPSNPGGETVVSNPEVPSTPSTPSTVETSTDKVETPSNVEAKKWKLKDPEGEFEADEEELKNGHLRFRDYTRKTQAVSAAKREIEAKEAALTEREQKINSLLSDAENVAQYYEFLTGKKLTPAQEARVEQGLAPNAGGGNSDEVATLKEAQQLAKTETDNLRTQLEKEMLEKVARTQQWTQDQINVAQARAEMQRNAVAYQSDINSTIDALATEHPILSESYDRQELEDLLCRDVMKHEPKDLNAAKGLLQQAAKDRATRLNKVVEGRQKAAVISKTELINSGIEPPGGATPGASPVKHKLGDKALTQSAIAFMESYKK